MSDPLALTCEPHPALCARARAGHATITIQAERMLEASPEAILSFLADLPNHAKLTDRHLRLRDVAPDGRGSRIAMVGPLGVRRTATTHITTVRAPSSIGGLALVGPRTRARVDWTIEPAPDGGARVELRAVVLSASPLDRALLAAGGRAWLTRRFREALQRLDDAPAGVTLKAVDEGVVNRLHQTQPRPPAPDRARNRRFGQAPRD